MPTASFTDPGDLDELNALIHDRWFDVDGPEFWGIHADDPVRRQFAIDAETRS
jgi:hypothetical protein